MGKWVQQPGDQITAVPESFGPLARNDTPNNTPKTGINMETIPSSAVCTFVGEGAANVVFELSGVEDHPGLNGQLLRLPKDESTGPSYSELQDYWENKVSPLFEPKELVQQRLVQLPQHPAFVESLNQQLEQIEQNDTRRRDFAGHRFDPEAMNTGMLVEDMRPRKAGSSRPSSRPSSSRPSSRPSSSGTGKGKSKAKAKGKGKAKAEEEEQDASDIDAGEEDLFTLHEIKPKWLHQSPRAPEGAEQCRNCAREVQRNLKNHTRNPVFCPLNLVKATDFPRNQQVVGDIKRHLGLSEAQSDNLQTWLHGSGLLRRLRAKQWELDHAEEKVVPSASSSGILSAGVGSSATSHPASSGAAEDAEEADNVSRYCLAMTLRDCSLFLRIPRRPDAKAEDVVAKLADLDKKNYGTKHEYWEGMEDGLHAKDLYWKSGGDGVSAQLTDCQLPFYKASYRNLPNEVREYYRLPLNEGAGGQGRTN